MTIFVTQTVRRVVLFVIGLFVLCSLLGIAYDRLVTAHLNFRKKELNYTEFVARLDSKQLEAVFLGDSHTYGAINPVYVSSTYNLAFSGDRYPELFFKFRRLLEQDKIKVKKVVLQVDENVFSVSVTNPFVLLKYPSGYASFATLREIATLRKTNIVEAWLMVHVPMLGNGDLVLDYLFKTHPPGIVAEGGWGPDFREYQYGLEMGAKKSTTLKDGIYINDQVSFAYFLDTIKLANQYGIQVVLIKYPMTKEYDEAKKRFGMDNKIYYETIFQSVNELTGGDYQFLDYYYQFADRPEFFSDATHIQARAVETFSRQVAQDLQ